MDIVEQVRELLKDHNDFVVSKPQGDGVCIEWDSDSDHGCCFSEHTTVGGVIDDLRDELSDMEDIYSERVDDLSHLIGKIDKLKV